MKESKFFKEFSDRLMKIVSEMLVLVGTLEDRRVVEKVLVGLPSRFETKICSIEDSKDINTLFVTELVNFLSIVEQRHKMRNCDPSQSALFA